MSSYIKHAIEGRIRLKHKALKDAVIMEKVLDILKNEKEVESAIPGSSSILIELSPEANFLAICKKIEKVVPELLDNDNIFGIDYHKFELRSLLVLSAMCFVFGFVKISKVHITTGILSSALMLKHVWDRRQSL